ncbi:hypothetical protein FOXB_02880 [Fusarium oxysporum f. sp. conglutinans Fo5176]|uniref:Uncharacterized protein n=1 Tax=Fusarium oxysporum (strain Fo5176) TaxID=660025 RepID=F9F905_FUSOF|nr:hypothetical protein FOXB_02880 [Fusarium oxysporum f. sp. conglutinans Fo5176]
MSRSISPPGCMAIEDGYHACSLDDLDLRDAHAVPTSFELYENEQVNRVNHNTKFARFLSRMFRGLPYPLAWVHDFNVLEKLEVTPAPLGLAAAPTLPRARNSRVYTGLRGLIIEAVISWKHRLTPEAAVAQVLQ